MSEHTPEPWRTDIAPRENNVYAVIRTESALCVGTVVFQDGSYTGPSREEMEANAHRIVACVNACAGLDTEKLAQGVGILAEFLPEWCIEEESR